MARTRDERARWQAAQEAEVAFWRNMRSIPTYRDFDPRAYWGERFSRLGVAADALRDQTVVEVGCGPLGMIFFLPPCGRKLGLDPLLGRFEVEKTADVALVRAVGESLPLRDRCADLVICQNVIDHVMAPDAVLREIRRIIRPEGRLFLMAHTFPAALCPFLGFDKPHPHHWPAARLLAMVQSHGFRVEHQEQEPLRLPVKWRAIIDPRTWKQIGANLIVSSTFVTARPA